LTSGLFILVALLLAALVEEPERKEA